MYQVIKNLGTNEMKYKKGLIFICLITCLFSIASVVAGDVNETVVASEDQSSDLIEIENQDEEIVTVNNSESDIISADVWGDEVNNQDILGCNESQDEISLDNDDRLSGGRYPSSSDYSLKVSDTVIGDDGGAISVSVTPAKGFTYYTCYYLKIYDSNNKEKFSQLESCTYYHIGHYFSIASGQLSVGTYTIKLINYADGKVMDTAKLTVKPTYPSYSDYSVRVSDISIYYGVGGVISMSITPASGSTLYYYCYYLKVYDSNNNENISELFSWTRSYHAATYNVGPNKLSVGTYTIKLVNYADGKVMDTAKLTVKPVYPSYSDYSVKVSDIGIDYGSSGSILMNISPAEGSNYTYYYYLNVYDSNNNQKISQLYFGSNSDNSKIYTLSSGQLSSGNYTVKIINYLDKKVMDTAKLTIIPSSTYPSYHEYSVSVSDTSINYESGGSINMKISPYPGSNYKYYYYMKIYDSNNNEKISQLYSSTNSDNSKIYTLSSGRLGLGTYTIKIINYKDNKVMDTAKLSVKSKTHVSAGNIRTIYGSGKNLIVTLKDTEDNLLIGKVVSVILNGKTYRDRTNYNGQISIKVPANLAPKTYTASIKFGGDDKYIASSKNVDIVVTKISPKITVKSITGNAGKKVKLTATVRNDFGNSIKKCTVAFKVNGKTYKAKTNSKGIATVKVKVPKSKFFKIYSKTKGKIVTKVTTYKKTYDCTASVSGNNHYKAGSTKFKVTSKNKKSQKYKIVKRQTKTITIPYKKYGYREKKSGHYVFGVLHEQQEGNRISILAGDKSLHKLIKFSSNAYYIYHGNKVYPWKWIKSKHNDDIHYYYYTGDVKVYVIIKYKASTYKRIK